MFWFIPLQKKLKSQSPIYRVQLSDAVQQNIVKAILLVAIPYLSGPVFRLDVATFVTFVIEMVAIPYLSGPAFRLVEILSRYGGPVEESQSPIYRVQLSDRGGDKMKKDKKESRNPLFIGSSFPTQFIWNIRHKF